MSRRPAWLTFAAIAAIAVLLLYARTLHFGFYWDDFDDLRPWTWSDLGRAFVGNYQPWAREGIYFYRPLTSVYLAAATALFGLNSVALHVIPLFTLTIAATLTGAFVYRESGSREAGAIGTVIYAVHPLTAAAIGPWIANQYQGFVVIAVLSALLIWRSRADALRLTMPLTIALIAAAWLKEDGLLLGPAIVVLHAARATLTRDVPRPARRAVLSILGVTVGLIAWRALWLPSQLGYGLRDPLSMIANATRAWRYALIWQTGDAPWAPLLTLAKSGAVIFLAWRFMAGRRDESMRLAVAGFALLLVMNLPLAFVSSENRWHVAGLSVALIMTAALSALQRPLRWLAVGIVVALLAVSATARIDVFAPCSAESLVEYKWATQWPELPKEMRAWLSTRDAACASGHFDAFSVPMRDMTWGKR